jgi:hypothetical protein
LFIEAVDTTAEWLGIFKGSEAHPREGISGMLGLCNEYTIRAAYATPEEMIAWEYILITETLDGIINKGTNKTYNTLLTHYGLTHTEASGTIKMARRFADNLCSTERIEDRALVLLRCEDMIHRSREACDANTEMKALKQMSAVLGLTRMEEEESLAELVRVSQKVTVERNEKSHKILENFRQNDE